MEKGRKGGGFSCDMDEISDQKYLELRGWPRLPTAQGLNSSGGYFDLNAVDIQTWPDDDPERPKGVKRGTFLDN